MIINRLIIIIKFAGLKMGKNKKQNRKSKTKSRSNTRRMVEQKIIDLVIAIPVAIASIYSLSDCTNGTGVTDRLGRMIYPKMLIIKCILTSSTTLIGSTVSSIRMVIFQDLQQVQATAPLITDVINPATVIGQRNLYFGSRFKILRDVVLKVDTYNPTINYVNNIRMSSFISYASALSTDIASKGLYVIFTGSNLTNPPNIVFSSRLMFTDE